jgi:hypothetical protein
MVTKEAAVVLLLLSVTGFVNGQEPWTMLGISNEFEVCWERCFQVTANCFVVVVVVQKFSTCSKYFGLSLSYAETARIMSTCTDNARGPIIGAHCSGLTVPQKMSVFKKMETIDSFFSGA